VRPTLSVLVTVVAFLVLGGCSGSSSGGASSIGDHEAVCSLASQLQRTGDQVERADVKDPAAFDAALDKAVQRYVDILDELHRVVPHKVQGDVEHLRAAVSQYRFDDGVDARVALESYTKRVCA